MRTAAVVCAGALVVSGCGSGEPFVAATEPPAPVNLSVYIGNARVQLSPARLSSGPVLLLVTNQSARNETLTLRPRRRGAALASTGPINPDSTAQVQVNLAPGAYALTARGAAPATLRIEAPRSNGNGTLLQP
jgi:hypothetical protein